MKFFLAVLFATTGSIAMAQPYQTFSLQKGWLCDDYARNKSEYERLGLSGDAKREAVCVRYLTEKGREIYGLPFFDKLSKRLEYDRAVFHSVEIRSNGFCFTFAGLDREHFRRWFHAFVADNSKIGVENYAFE